MPVRATVALFAALAAAPISGVAAPAPVAARSCAAPPTGWITSRQDSSQVVNTIVIYDKTPGPMSRASLPTWNGSTVNAAQLHQYVGITKRMNPVPTLLLVVSPRADCEEVQFVRQIVDGILDCGTDQCVEVAP